MKRIIQNTAFQLIGSILSKLIGLAFVIVASRSLGSEQYGKYSFVFTFTALFTMLASFGIPIIATRELAKNERSKEVIIGDIIIIKIMLGVIASVLCLVFSKILGYGADLQLGFKIVIVGLLFSFLQSYQSYFQATLQMQYDMLSSVLRDVLLLVSALYLAHIKAGFISFVWAGMLTALISGLFLTWQGYRLIKPKFSFDRKRITKFIMECFPLGLASFAVYIYYNADTIMLSKLSTMVAVGYYAVAYKFVFIGQLIPQALGVSIFPGFSHDVLHNKEKAESNFKTAYELFSYMAFGFATLGILYHQDVILLLFGEKYLPASVPLLIFSISFIFMIPNMVVSRYLVAVGDQKYIFYVHLFSAALNVLLNFYAIPRFGVAGAAATTMFSDFMVFCAFFIKVNRLAEYIKISLLKFIYLAFIGTVLIAIGKLININWIIESLLICVVYLCYVFKKNKNLATLVYNTYANHIIT